MRKATTIAMIFPRPAFGAEGAVSAPLGCDILPTPPPARMRGWLKAFPLRTASGSDEKLNSVRVLPAAVKPRNRDAILVLLASVLWGTSFPGSKLTVGTVDPLFLTFARMALGALLGVVVLAAMRRFDLRMFREPLVWVLGAINAVGFELQNEGILLTTATKTALLVNVNVVIIPVLMVLFFREAMTRLKGTGILIGTLGVVVVATKFDPATLAGGQFAGDVLVFVAGVVWAFYVVGAKRMVDRGGDYVALTARILATTAVLAAIPLFFVGWPLPTNGNGWLGIAYLGLVPTFTPLVLYVASMRTISPTISGLLILLEVVVAAVLSFLFLRDPLGPYTLAGGALLLFGAYVVPRGGQSVDDPASRGLAAVPSDATRQDAGRIIRR